VPPTLWTSRHPNKPRCAPHPVLPSANSVGELWTAPQPVRLTASLPQTVGDIFYLSYLEMAEDSK
jgi:hypothetical protein